MKIYGFILIFICFSAFAQEEDYYKESGNRKKSYEIENLPHLNSGYTTFYFGLNGGFRKPFYNMPFLKFDDFGENNHPMNTTVSLNYGFNHNDNVFFESGISIYKNLLNSYVYPTEYNPGFSVTNRSREIFIPIRIRKKIVSLNRVTQNASINVSLGGGFLVKTTPAESTDLDEDIQKFINSPILSNYFVTLRQSRSLILGEAGIEIRGFVFERLELSLFFRGLLRNSGYMENSFIIHKINDPLPKQYIISEKSGAILFGIEGRFHSKRYFKYFSKI